MTICTQKDTGRLPPIIHSTQESLPFLTSAWGQEFELGGRPWERRGRAGRRPLGLARHPHLKFPDWDECQFERKRAEPRPSILVHLVLPQASLRQSEGLPGSQPFAPLNSSSINPCPSHQGQSPVTEKTPVCPSEEEKRGWHNDLWHE